MSCKTTERLNGKYPAASLYVKYADKIVFV